MLIFWLIILVLGLVLVVKSADWVVESAETIALVLKISPFIIGVTIVGFGTSCPELSTALTATFRGSTEFVVDTVFGSNIANILLIIGIAAIAGRKLIVKRELINLDAPLLTASTALIFFIVLDRKVVFLEGVLLMLAFMVYILYAIFQRKERAEEEVSELIEVLPCKLNFKTFFFLILGLVGLIIGSHYIVESVIRSSELLKISASLLTVTVVAVGTSLPEFVVSISAALKKKYELALGNIFGSNVFNIFFIIGLPALFRSLVVNETTLSIGLPYLIVATLLFVVSGISRKIHIWEGLMYVLVYILFIAQFSGLL